MESPIERLAKAHPDLEIWWDSSPLVYDKWTERVLEAASPDRRSVLAEQFKRLYNLDEPEKSLVRGCTTNPSLSLKAVKSDPEFWNEWIDETIRANPNLDQEELTWITYKEVVKRGAEMMMPIWEASDGRFGWISGQLDPRLFTEKEEMVRQAEELHALQPNVMIKVPGSKEGIDVLRILASKGIATNTTVCFTLSQIIASARATAEGLQMVQKDHRYNTSEAGVDLTKWRAVITMMTGRLTERDALTQQAERRGIELTWADRHWFGIAVFQRAYRFIQEGGYPSKMLACSMRQGPLVAGKPRFWDVENLAGDVVFTCPPYVLEPLLEVGEDLTFEGGGIETIEVPQKVLDKILQIPYGIQSYDPNGMSLEQFNTCPSTQYTIKGFSGAFEGLLDYVGERMAQVGG